MPTLIAALAVVGVIAFALAAMGLVADAIERHWGLGE